MKNGRRSMSAMAWLARVISVCLAMGCGESRGPRDDDAVVDAGDSTLPDHTAGKGCKRDADCPNGRCMRELQVGSMTEAREAPGGYCTAACASDLQCGEGAECSVGAGADRGLCLGACHTQRDCRDGYVCVGSTHTLGLQISGSCQPRQSTDSLGARVAGRACAADDECKGGQCATVTALGTKFPGNYCTGRCFEDAECGEGGVCIATAASAEAGYCYASCDADSDCDRRGYRCLQMAGSGACFPAPESLPDGMAGKPCSDDAACGGGKDTCAKELPFGSFAAYEVVPAPGGYCTQTCSRDFECGSGAQCISRGTRGGMCLGTCNERSDCREGYSCTAHGRDLDENAKVCAPIIGG